MILFSVVPVPTGTAMKWEAARLGWFAPEGKPVWRLFSAHPEVRTHQTLSTIIAVNSTSQVVFPSTLATPLNL